MIGKNVVSAGVAVGGGWQGLVAYINMFCYYIIGLPIGFLLGYKTDLGVQVVYGSSLWSVGLIMHVN